MDETYTHFNTVEECDVFVRTLIHVIGRCCGGKGVCIRTSTFYYVVNNPREFPVIPSTHTKHVKHTEDIICCVCYEESEEITPCGHLVCQKCLPFIGQLCPCCRQPLF